MALSAISAAIGVILGGYLSDLWRQRSANGRLYVNMLSALLPIPLVAFLLTTDSLAAFYWVNPVAHMVASAWVGAAVATLQDLVLPRMRATAGATYILGTTMVGLALGATGATAIFGGLTPFLAQYLVERTGMAIAPGLMIALVSLAVLPLFLVMRETAPKSAAVPKT